MSAAPTALRPDPSSTPPATHEMMPASTHDEEARLGYVVALKQFLMRGLDPRFARLVNERVAPACAKDGEEPDFREVERSLRGLGVYRTWQALTFDAQEAMWRHVGACVERQLNDLKARTAQVPQRGSVRITPGFVAPPYLKAVDIHFMPGGYTADRGEGDVFQGAVFDKAAAIYHMGRNGGELNDVRGHTIVQHVYDRFPDLQPRKILDMGCTVGHSTVAIARSFPEAEVHAIDVGGALLRYAHARAAALGAGVHFAQQNAECTDYPDGSFDLVVSAAMLHETSNKALPRILAECRRLLRPGGVMVHLEVPLRFEDTTTWSRIRGYYEAHFNNEPFWMGAQSADIAGIARAAGLKDVVAGYQDAVPAADRSRTGGFRTQAGPVHACWYMVSGRA
jgi:ubiquinone/menaquinone biosynthesis C-methylase UbiE